MIKKSWLLSLILPLIVSLFFDTAAFAHTRVELNDYAVIIGWLNEPPIVGERNALLLQISRGEEPLTGAESTLDLEVLYGGRSFRTNLLPANKAGEYHATIFPTVRGKYQVRLFGKLGDLAVDQTVEPEEVFAADRLQFPEVQPELRQVQSEMQNQLEALQSQLRTAQWAGYGGAALGLISLIIALFAQRQRN